MIILPEIAHNIKKNDEKRKILLQDHVVFPIQNNPKNLDLSYKLDLERCLGRDNSFLAEIHMTGLQIWDNY